MSDKQGQGLRCARSRLHGRSDRTRRLEIHQRLAGEGQPPPPELQHVLGEVLLARGDAAGARAALGQALEDWEKAGANPALLAPVRFDLARALHLERREPARVRALANAAREAVASTPEPRRVKLADINAFLEAIPPRPQRRLR